MREARERTHESAITVYCPEVGTVETRVLETCLSEVGAFEMHVSEANRPRQPRASARCPRWPRPR
jgi:hypothetical protein